MVEGAEDRERRGPKTTDELLDDLRGRQHETESRWQRRAKRTPIDWSASAGKIGTSLIESFVGALVQMVLEIIGVPLLIVGLAIAFVAWLFNLI